MRRLDDDNSEYTDIFIRFSTIIELWLRRVIVVLIIGLFLFQILLQNADIRYYLSAIDRLEGIIQVSEERD